MFKKLPEHYTQTSQKIPQNFFVFNHSYISHNKNLFKQKETRSSMNKWIEILLGLVLLIGAILIAWYSAVYSWVFFGHSFNFLTPAWVFFKGGLFWFVIMIGVLFIMLGISDLKD